MTGQNQIATDESVTLDMLNRCHTEPIHRPGAVQDHALLVACDPQGIITQVSANSADWLHIPPERLLGHPLAMVLPRAAAVLSHLPQVDDAGHPQVLDLGSLTRLDGEVVRPLWWGVRRAKHLLLEAELVDPSSPHDPAAGPVLPPAEDERQAAQGAIALLAPVLGYDRIIAYGFFPGGEGEVVAEAKTPDLEPYLGLRYPASDIPDQVRALALRTPLRVLADATAGPVPLITDPAMEVQPLDLSLSAVRSQSPMYREYLRNMGIRGTMSASVIVAGRLWGLLICNHRGLRRPGLTERTWIKSVALALGRHLEDLERRLDETLEDRCRALVAPLTDPGAELETWIEVLAERADKLLHLLQAGGFALVTPERILTLRTAPPTAAIRTALAVGGTSIIHDGSNRALANALQFAPGSGGSACGMLAVPVGRGTGIGLCWFRPEHNHEITWAGDMTTLGKSITRRPDGVPVFHPRRSFAAWTQQVRGLSRPWSRRDRQAASVLASLLGAALEVQATSRPRFHPFAETPAHPRSPESGP